MSFQGFPIGGVHFYERLAADNTKAFWQANRHLFDEQVRAPMAAFCDELEAEYGPFHLFRPYNDMRFARGRPPYKTHQGAYAESEGGAGYYVQISAEGLMCAAGYYAMAPDQLERFRRAVLDDVTGAVLAGIVDDLARRYQIGAVSELKTAPRGVPKDHPRIGLLRRRGLIASISFGMPPWVHRREALTRVRRSWRGVQAMCDWLDERVGPSTLPPPEMR